MKSKNRFYRIAVIMFILLNALFLTTKARLENWNFDQEVLILGNLFLFLVTIGSFVMHTKAMEAKSTPAFLRFVYLAMFGKLMLCAIGAMIYIFMMKQNVNKPSLFLCMFLYILYTFVEIKNLMKLNEERKNAG